MPETPTRRRRDTLRLNLVALVELRQREGLTQAGLAKRVGVSPSFIGDVESGRRNVRPDMVERLTAALNCHYGALIARHCPADCWCRR